MLSPGDRAPDFELPGTGHSSHVVYRLDDALGPGGVLVVFSTREDLTTPHSTTGLAPWFQFLNGTRVCIVTDRRLPSTGSSLPEYLRSVPVLVDPDRSVADRYGARFGAFGSASAFLVDADRRVALADRLDAHSVKQLPERIERARSRRRVQHR